MILRLKILLLLLLSTTFLFMSTAKTFAYVPCGQSITNVSLWPVNSGVPNPMKNINLVPSYNGYNCSTSDTKRVYSDPPPYINWRPQLINYGNTNYNLTYRVVYNKMNSAPNSCVASWNNLDPSQVPAMGNQTFINATSAMSVTVPRNGTPVALDLDVLLYKNPGIRPLDSGWYQIDIQPGCRWGAGPNDINWTSAALGATFFYAGCNTPGAPTNLTAVGVTSSGDYAIRVGWSPPAGVGGLPQGDVVGYIIWRYNSFFNAYIDIVGIVDGSTTSYIDRNYGFGYSCSNPLASPNPGAKSYKVSSVGCNGGSTSASVNGTTPLCPPPPCALSSTSSCANSGQSKAFTVTGTYDSPIQQSSWSSSIGSVSKPVSPVNQGNLLPNSVANTTAGTVSFHDSLVSCSYNVNVYPTASFNVSLKESYNKCSDQSILNGISGKPIEYNDTSSLGYPNPNAPVSTDSSGNATISNVYIKDPATCNNVGYQVKIPTDNFVNYNLCSTLCASGSLNCWYRSGNYWIYQVSSINPAAKNITLPTLTFESNIPPIKWLEVNQGNISVTNSDITLTGSEPSDRMIDQSGSIYTAGSLSLSTGGVGGSSPDYDAYTYQNYILHDDSALDKVFDLYATAPSIFDVVTSGGGGSECSIPSSSTNTVLFANNCDITISIGLYNGSNLPSNYKLVIIKGGNLNVDKEVVQLDASFIVENDVILEEVPVTSQLTINGYLWTKGDLLLNRKLLINSKLEYIDDPILKALINSEIAHTSEID